MRALVKTLLALGILASHCAAADPVGPAVVATMDNSLWPEAINTQAGFDKASRAAQFVYLQNLLSMQTLSDEEMLAAFKIKSVNRNSVEKWIDRELTLTIDNYRQAASTCTAEDWTCIEPLQAAADFSRTAASQLTQLPAQASAWHSHLKQFSHSYIAEQMRLAALFPKVSSEIDTFNSNEWTGSTLADREFYLTFDDGPSKAQGRTDETLAMLAAEKKSAIFFVLGSNFQQRINATGAQAVKALYTNHCVALHGWEHQSHAKWEQWQDSVARARTLVAATIAAENISPLFRPPYGQRKADSLGFFTEQHLQVALWNLDSQDWNTSVTASAVENRVIALMLIKRHGVILFHDIHAKAATALPKIFAGLGTAVNWQDCHTLDKKH